MDKGEMLTKQLRAIEPHIDAFLGACTLVSKRIRACLSDILWIVVVKQASNRVSRNETFVALRPSTVYLV